MPASPRISTRWCKTAGPSQAPRHDPRPRAPHDRGGRRKLFHKPVFVRRPPSRGGHAFRRHFRTRDAACVARAPGAGSLIPEPVRGFGPPPPYGKCDPACADAQLDLSTFYFPASNEHSAPPPALSLMTCGSSVQLSLETLSKIEPAAPSEGMPAIAAVANT